MHHIQRKPSNETLTSVGMDSTLDSRMSSAEVPQMELLKVNYVHQCKEAFMTKTGSSPNYSYMEYKRSLPQVQLPAMGQSRKNVARIAINQQTGRQEAPNKPLPPPPLPTVESWQFIQSPSKRTTNSPPKFIQPPAVATISTDPPPSCSHSSQSSCDTGCESDNTVSGEGVKSNSWNYRNRISTCDIRRDIARAGIKSRADRIARIEQTECEHGSRSKNLASPINSMTTSNTTTTTANSKEAVAKINRMFEQQQKQQILPPQPSRPAPVPHKEPNRRLKPPLPTLQQEYQAAAPTGRLRQLPNNDCVECLSAQENCRPVEVSPSREDASHNRYRRPENKELKPVSRIPKPIQEVRNLNEHKNSEKNSMSQRSPEKLPDNGRRFEKHSPPGDKEQNLGKHSRLPAAGQYQKSKIERVHIRKKRQPLLIINQLNEPPKSLDDGDNTTKISRLTCGYKNCNFANCPMSKSQHDLHKLALEEEEAETKAAKCQGQLKLKRLSLESNSDSGVSSSNDEHNRAGRQILPLKNLEKCSDGKINYRASKKSEHFEDYAYEKFKISKTYEDKEKEGATNKASGSHIKIQVGKSSITSFSGNYSNTNTSSNGDPNDVTNFSKKNLTKATTHEVLNNSTLSLANAIPKQCNLENEQRLKIQNNLQTKMGRNLTKIQIDDDWVMDGGGGAGGGRDPEEDFIETDSLMITESSCAAVSMPLKKPINSNDNSVKIFVRSSAQNNHDLTRSSCISANSFASQTSLGTENSSSHSTCSSASCCSSSTASSSGCSASSHNGDNQSLCGSERDCCCQFSNTNGMFFHRPASSSSAVSRISEEQRACAASPLSSTDAISQVSCSSCSTDQGTVVKAETPHGKRVAMLETSKLSCCQTDSGVFWNNSYMSLDGQEPNDVVCYCSMSSCEEDNCSYYEVELEPDNVKISKASSKDNIKIEITNQQSHKDERVADIPCKPQYQPLPHRQQHPTTSHAQKLQAAHVAKRNGRLSTGEDILKRNQLLRKTDVIHELRPRSMDCAVDSGVSLNGDNGCSSDAGESQQDMEARRLKRGHVLSELLETERIYVSEMSSILKGYCDQMHSEEMIHLVPASLQGKEDILFGNLHELYTFHNDVFLKDLENCISTTELVALCFVQRRDTFYRLYSFYCQNIPRSDRLRETLVDTHLFLQECQKRLGHKLPLAAYLLKPVQRITKYQLLLKDLLRFSDNGSCTKELQKALDCMLIVLKCVNDSMHQVAITGFPTDLSQQGELLLQDSFQVWSESKKDIRLRIKPQQRHIFLYQKSMLFCKQTSKPGHNKSTYQFKHYLKMSQIGLTESVRGDTKRFEVWLQGRQEVHTLQAPTLDIKNKWVAEIKKVLLTQLEELKGEKIKQYGLNHRGLRQTTSWDTPNILYGPSGRTISCDASSESSNRNSNCSSSDDNCTTIGGLPLSSNGSLISGITINSTASTTGTDKEHNEACGWSSDYSNSEDEMSTADDNSSTPGSKYVALADYVAVGHSEVSMREGDTVELLKVGCAGWWYVRILDTNAEGWTPAAYLESINRKSSRSSSRNQERLNLQQKVNE
uniref:Guanine nucleotide exchange factor DBS n=1 Tax=Stomoxys calcitrans TaxID=35570 RepID=A0A1I8PJP2_STOCA